MAENRQPNNNLAELQKSQAEEILPVKHFRKRGEGKTIQKNVSIPPHTQILKSLQQKF